MKRKNIVGNLTVRRAGCHKPDAWRRWPVAVLLVAGLLLGAEVGAGNWHDPADISSTAEEFLRELLEEGSTPAGASRTASVSLDASGLDSRLKLAACNEALTGFLRPGTRVAPRTVVGIRCSGSKPWKVYVPVRLSVSTQVWVATKPLSRGHIIGSDDIVAEHRDVAYQTTAYVPATTPVTGQRLRNSVLPGRALEPGFLEADKVIRRGQSVTLSVQSNGIDIRMTGLALADGAINQRIQVENMNSGRVVEGIVRTREVVEILLPGNHGQPVNQPKVSPPPADTLSSNNES